MAVFAVCATCGNYQQPVGAAGVPELCPVCADERQWVPPGGQRWTNPGALAEAGFRCVVRQVEAGLAGVGVEPDLAIGQRALLVSTPRGGVLWDPPGFLDDTAVAAVRAVGGLLGVAASHPHFYGAAAVWCETFPGASFWVCRADRGWVGAGQSAVVVWEHRAEVAPGVTLVQCGGHFPGSAVLHWPAGAAGAGALLVGDTVMVTPGADRVTFQRSAPNRLPLPEPAVQRVAAVLARLRFDRIYTGWWEPVLDTGAQQAVAVGAARYIAWLRGEAGEDW